jgi:hypothetical protein
VSIRGALGMVPAVPSSTRDSRFNRFGTGGYHLGVEAEGYLQRKVATG